MMLQELIKTQSGILRLKPAYVHRFYPDLNRLGQSRHKRNARQFVPERWIGSSIEAINPPPIPCGGLSMLHGTTRPIALRDAIRAAPMEMIGEKLLSKHGPEFRVLVKILDPGEPIVFHLHATDAQVRSMPRHFAGHRFGKDEAYYFLEAPKGPVPYTHVGLHEGVTRRDLIEAVHKGRDLALELSPAIYQQFGAGFFVPAGVPHRPGTALTLEIQQPSDVYALLETHAGGKRMSPRQIHPGFKSLDEASELIDMKLSTKVGRLDDFRLLPPSKENITWIFPPGICKKFAGKRIRVEKRVRYIENSAFILLIWKGAGKINGRRVRGGDEFFVTHWAARNVDMENTGEDLLEAFSFFPL